MVYKSSIKACGRTCALLNESCALQNTEGCVCPVGTLLEQNKCISPDECGCIDDNNSRHEVITKEEKCFLQYVFCMKFCVLPIIFNSPITYFLTISPCAIMQYEWIRDDGFDDGSDLSRTPIHLIICQSREFVV